MTLAAWIMMTTTFAIVTTFTMYFFVRVLRAPASNEQNETANQEPKLEEERKH